MKIALISLVEDVFIPSLRVLSAYLREMGHETKLILLPWGQTDPALHAANSFRYPYPMRLLEQLGTVCADCDAVGLSLMTCHFDNAIHVTRHLRKLGKPIIWGGVHPTIRPKECLQYADAVCVGEGELPLSWWNGNHGILRGNFIEDYDALPLPDYNLSTQWLFYRGNLEPVTAPIMAEAMNHAYQPLFSRGCPYSCTYCCNNAFKTINGRKLPVRWRSVDKRIAELKAAIQQFPSLTNINFADDSFLSQPLHSVQQFAERYRKEIGLPFAMLTTPRSVTEEKLTLMAEAGLYSVGIGVQSGSSRIHHGLYQRHETVEEIVKVSKTIKQVADKVGKQILTRYDFIVDNPWETESDTMESINLCAQLEKPFNLAVFSLTTYPGTALYEKAKEENMLHDELNTIYRRSQLLPERTYLNGLFALAGANAPQWVMKMVTRHHKTELAYRLAGWCELVKWARGCWNYVKRGEWKPVRILGYQAWCRIKYRLKPIQPLSTIQFCGAPGEAHP